MKHPMKHPVIRTLLISIVLVAIPLQAQSTKDAFIGVSKKELEKDYNHLVMTPIISATALALPASVEKLIEDEILKQFDKAGYEILPPSAFREIKDQFTALYQGAAPASDKDKAKRQRALSDHSYRELYYRYPVKGLITVQVVPIGAPFNSDKAVWDGTSQKIKHRGDGLLKMFTGKKYGGTVAVSSIKISISDRQGVPIYYWAGGIEVLMERNGEALEPLPSSKFWQDEKRVLKAVKYALKPL